MAGQTNVGALGWVHDCGAFALTHLPLAIALLAGGLAGSFTHCLGMCSTFVLGQTGSVADEGIWGRLLLPYHLGRVTTYASLGALAGLSFHSLVAWPPFIVVRHLLLALVAVIFLSVFAERFLSRYRIRLPFRLGFHPGCAVGAMRRAAGAPNLFNRFALGLVLGLLPCPLIYAALLAVAARGDVVGGTIAMAAFAIGTTPALMGLSVTGGQFLNNKPKLKDGLSLAAMGVNGVILLGLAIG